MKKKHSIYIAVFILLFIAPTILYAALGEYIDTENFEKREMAEKPQFSLAGVAAFPTEYESYYNNNLPFRAWLIRLKSAIHYRLFGESWVDKVIVGKDGWLFYNPAGTDGDNMADYYCTNSYSDERLAAIAENLLASRDALQQQNCQFVVFIAPNKASIYGGDYLPDEYAPGDGITRGDQLYQYLREYTDLTVVYGAEALKAARATHPDYEYYYKQDTHWNYIGSYVGACQLLQQLQISMPDLSSVSISPAQPRAGDLAVMLGWSEEQQYDQNYTVTGYATHAVTSIPSEEDTIRRYTAAGADPRKLMVIGDSFSEFLIPYCSSQFCESFFVNYQNYTPDQIAAEKPDIVVFEVVERYTKRLSEFSAVPKS